MEFVYVTRLKVWEQLQQQKAKFTDVGEEVTWRYCLRSLSRASSLCSAHTHFLAAITSQRTECFSEHVRLLLIVNLRRMRTLSTGQVKQLWMVAQEGPDHLEELTAHTRQWL